MLPFIAGIAFGSLGVIALKNKEKLKEATLSGLDKGINKSKVVLQDAKEKITSKIEKPKRNVKRSTRKKSETLSVKKSEE